jgi:nucleoside-diphosphate-sugar epimerase
MDLYDSHESSDLIPFNDYGKSKLQAEQIFSKWSESQKDRTLSIVRPTVVFGEGNRGNVYNLMKQVAENRFIMVGSGQNRKSIAYVGNLVEYIVSIIGDSESSIVNYADKPDLTMEALIALTNKSLHKKGRRLHIPYWIGLTGGYLLDLISFVSRKKFPISAIRIKKFCSNSTINTDKLMAQNTKNLVSLPSAVKATIEHEFIKS